MAESESCLRKRVVPGVPVDVKHPLENKEENVVKETRYGARIAGDDRRRALLGEENAGVYFGRVRRILSSLTLLHHSMSL